MHVFFGFKNKQLITVIYSLCDETEEAVDCDYYVADPQDVEKQIAKWKNEHKT